MVIWFRLLHWGVFFFWSTFRIVGVGIFALPTALWEHHSTMKRRRRERQIQNWRRSGTSFRCCPWNEEKIDQVLRRQQRKIKDLESTLGEAQKKWNVFKKQKKAPQRSEEKQKNPLHFLLQYLQNRNTIIAPTIAVTSCGNVSMVANVLHFLEREGGGREK